MTEPIPLSQYRGQWPSKVTSLMHRESYVKAVANARGEDPLVYSDGVDFVVLMSSLYHEGALDFLSFRNSFKGPLAGLVKWALKTETFLVCRGIDGRAIHPALSEICSKRSANIVDVNHSQWQRYLDTLKAARRRRVRFDLERYAVSPMYGFESTTSFHRLLGMQEQNLYHRKWSLLGEYALQEHSRFWRNNILLLCEHFPESVGFTCTTAEHDGIPAATMTLTLADTCQFITTFWDERYAGAGLSALAHAVKQAVGTSNISYFDLMGGGDQYKERYCPLPVKELQLTVIPPSQEEASRKMDLPFVFDGKLKKMAEVPLPFDYHA